MPLEVADLADIVTATLQELGRKRVVDLSVDRNEYTALTSMMKRNRVTYESGKTIDVNVQDGYDEDRAKFVGLFQTDNYNVEDRLSTGSIPWRFVTANYIFDKREPQLNSGASQIVDVIKSRRTSTWYALHERFEDAFWGVPSGTSDKVTPFGVFYWLVNHASEGFYGGNHANYSAGAAGIDSDTTTRWKNWTATYTTVNKADLIRKWRKASVYTKFKTPVKILDTYDGTDDCTYYTNYTVLGTLEEILEAQNESLGNDIASKDTMTVFRKRPVQWVDELDANTHHTDPVVGLNWGTFKTVFLRNTKLVESEPHVVAGQHNVCAVDMDLSMNWRCTNRRKNFLLTK